MLMANLQILTIIDTRRKEIEAGIGSLEQDLEQASGVHELVMAVPAP